MICYPHKKQFFFFAVSYGGSISIDSMGRKTFTGKIEFTPHEAEQLKNLAKKAISASAVIADLKKKLEAAR